MLVSLVASSCLHEEPGAGLVLERSGAVSAEQLLRQALGGGLGLAGHDVGVRRQGDHGRTMPEELGDEFDWLPVRQHEAGRGVPAIVQPQRR